MKRILSYILAIFFLTSVSIQANTELEKPIVLPKTEGSKNFDLEISIANQNGINQFESKLFSEAREYFMKAQSLAKQFRDPGLGIASFNLGLTLHKLNLHENAVEAFLMAKKYARGNSLILDSKLLLFHECGFNPSIPCDEKPPSNMHIEGSD
ncbi:MAG: tetratricopeptide repeat protein [Nitrospinota bacterium]|nr:tetratricopeptide repeat protein [Nitrospinota bacterium]